MFIRRAKDNRRIGNRPLTEWRAWVVVAISTLSLTATVVGQPAAGLLPPQPVRNVPAPYVSRGADADPDSPVTLPKASPRSTDFRYPPTYTSSKPDKNFPLLTGLWKSVVGDDEKKTLPTKDVPKPATTAKTPPNAEPLAEPYQGPAYPAWRWYGYGAPVLGFNPLAPQGVYAPVNPAFYMQTGATPGAVPKSFGPLPETSLLPQPLSVKPSSEPPVLPLPEPRKKSEVILPPDEPASSPDRPASINVPHAQPILQRLTPPGSPNSTGRPAALKMPGQPILPKEAEPTFTPILPVSARSMAPVVRAQSPEAATVPNELVTNLRTACVGYASRIELTSKGPNQLGIRMTLVSGIQADALAERIAKLRVLSDYEVEMEFAK